MASSAPLARRVRQQPAGFSRPRNCSGRAEPEGPQFTPRGCPTMPSPLPRWPAACIWLSLPRRRWPSPREYGLGGHIKLFRGCRVRFMLRPGRLLALPERTFTLELSAAGSPRTDVEYDYVGRQPVPTAGLAPASHAALWAAHSRPLLRSFAFSIGRSALARVYYFGFENGAKPALFSS